MSNRHCLLCASDEGILLDLYGVGGKALRENVESCLLVKIKRSDAPSTKICHKCAWELDCCGKFIQKYNKPRNSKESKVIPKRKHCILCCEEGSKVFLLTLRRGNTLKNFLSKIQNIFTDTPLNEKLENASICLDCRYNVDVLFDLKNIYNTSVESLKSVIEKDLKVSDLPKTKTRVVTRITTQTSSSGLSCDSSYDSDTSGTSTMSLKRSKTILHKDNISKPVVQYRKCEECNTSIPYGIDMYRHHRTGVTVCKECWLTMDPEKMVNGKRRKVRNPSTRSSTKLCAVFLKDVLSNPSKYKSVYKTEKDEHGNMTFLITDDSSETDEKEKISPKRLRKHHVGVTSSDAKATKRTATTKNDDEPPKKIATKGKAKLIESSTPPESTTIKLKTKNGGAVSSDPIPTLRTTRSSARPTTDTPSNTESTQISDVATNKKVVPKRSKLPKSSVGKVLNPGPKSPAKETTIIETSVVRSTRTRRMRSNSFTSHDTLPVDNTPVVLNETGTQNKVREKKTKSSKSVSPTQKTVKSDSELEKPYICSVCDVVYKNKLIGMAHELTHAKQPEVKLKRVVIPEVIDNTKPEEYSIADQHEEQSHHISSSSDDKIDHPPATKEAPVSKESEVTTMDKNEDESTTEKSTSKIAEITEEKDDLETENLNPEVTETSDKKEDSENEDLDLKITEVSQDIDETREKSPDSVEEPTHIDLQLDEKEPQEAIEKPLESQIIKNEETITEGVKVANNPITLDESEDDEVVEVANEDEVKVTKEVEIKVTKIDEVIEVANEDEVMEVANEDNDNLEKDEAPKKLNEDKEDDEVTKKTRDENENNDDIDLTIPEDDITIESSNVTESSEKISQAEKEESCDNKSQEAEKAESPKEIKETTANKNTIKVISRETTPDVEKDDDINKDAVVDVETDLNIPTIERSEKDDDADVTVVPTTVVREETSPVKEVKEDDAVEKNEAGTPVKETQDKSVEKVVTEVPTVPETSEGKAIDGPDSMSIASDIVDEVFDLANAEVKKRLEKAKSDDEHCTTPVSETLENISQEIRNSADMPSLELEDQSSNNHL